MEIIIGKSIEIKGSMKREKIVKKVINTFIETEGLRRGHGIKFRYPVENLSTGEKLFIIRPAGLRKWNFDFKVEVLPKFGLGRGTHKEIISDFMSKKQENPKKFHNLLKILTIIYKCSENDVDTLLKKYSNLQNLFKTGAKVDVLLKLVKWMFIMEDIVYWNYKGRSMLYEGILEMEI